MIRGRIGTVMKFRGKKYWNDALNHLIYCLLITWSLFLLLFQWIGDFIFHVSSEGPYDHPLSTFRLRKSSSCLSSVSHSIHSTERWLTRSHSINRTLKLKSHLLSVGMMTMMISWPQKKISQKILLIIYYCSTCATEYYPKIWLINS